MSDAYQRAGHNGADLNGHQWAWGTRGPITVLTVNPPATELHFDTGTREQFAQAFVLACAQAKVNAEQQRADGMNKVERLARNLMSIPDGL